MDHCFQRVVALAMVCTLTMACVGPLAPSASNPSGTWDAEIDGNTYVLTLFKRDDDRAISGALFLPQDRFVLRGVFGGRTLSVGGSNAAGSLRISAVTSPGLDFLTGTLTLFDASGREVGTTEIEATKRD